MDVGLPGRSGLEALGYGIQLAPDCRAVILTVFEDQKKISAASMVKLLARLTKPRTPVSLSPSELEMLSLTVDGLTAKKMADQLGVSIHIGTHPRHLFKKLDVRSRTAAVARALRERMI